MTNKALHFLRVIAVGVSLSGIPAALPSPARADACLADIWDNGLLSPGYVFPNWKMVYVGNFTAMFYDGYVGTEVIQRLTVVNFGSATNLDIKAVYWKASCGATTTGIQTLTYAGVFTEDSGPHPAWTWSGASPDFSGCAALWALGPGGITIDLYVDINPCPTMLNTIVMGFPINSVSNTVWWGSIYDNQGCIAPWSDVKGPYKSILYTTKESDMSSAAPGDTVTYTITYGRPGTADLTSVEIMDTQPPYTHYVFGSAVPPLDPGWDPNPGPPVKLKWTIPAPHPVNGGPTGRVTFQLTVDWGNGESFEPGSGDAGAPEGERLRNSASIMFNGIAGCPGYQTVVNPPITTVVRRFMFWKVADNDILFSQSLGQPPDEMIYEIFIKNTSDIKTWWNVQVWDTVPPEIDFFCNDCGFEDSCAGWTTTPTGCASAGPTWAQPAPGVTLLNWRLDMVPGLTLSLRWKGKVKGSSVEGSTAVNRASILAYGRQNIVGGTGHSGKQRNFTHSAPIVLPTMYTSYMAFGTFDNFDWGCPGCGDDGGSALTNYTYYIAFYPLNKKANFSLFQQLHPNDLFAQRGGITPPINLPVGGCMTGGLNWDSGCKAERAPAIYHPTTLAACPSFTVTRHNWKLVSNSPLIWELLTGGFDGNNDQITYSGSASLTYSGFTSYSFARVCSIASDLRDNLFFVNTSSSSPTSIHAFLWDPTTLSWSYKATGELDVESQWVYALRDMGHYKAISSDGAMILLKGYPGLGTDVTGNNNHGTLAPNRTNGYLASPVGSGDFYAYAGGPAAGDMADLVIGNSGAAPAVFDVFMYVPENKTLPITNSLDHLTPMLVDSSGHWVQLASGVTAGAGLASTTNPYVFGKGYDGLLQEDYALYKVSLKSGGPIQVWCGRDVFSGFASGHVMHSTTTPPSGAEYWFHQSQSQGTGTDEASCSNSSPVYGLAFFCPKQGTAVQMVSGDGWSARYTTDGPDEEVFFARFLTNSNLGAPNTRNYKITAAGGTIVSAFNVTCQLKQKLYSAPFLSQGVHYSIIAPPVVFVGQSFWITVVVLESSGQTKTDYTGTTSFTSTDPGAKIQGSAMDTYNYTWVLGDAGVKVFINVTLNTMGIMTIVGQDTLDGSINGLTTVMVVAADVKLEKRKTLSIAASGDTVTFQICWSNYSTATAQTFVITDAVPNGTAYVPEVASLALCGWNGPAAPTITMAYSASTSTTPPTNFATLGTGSSATSTTRWLRWVVRDVYVYSTGCICFKVTVD